MRTMYYRKVKPANATWPLLAVLDTMPTRGGYRGYSSAATLITRIRVPDGVQGQGVGTALLTEVCQDADAEGVTLLLEFNPYTGTDPQRLAALYRRFNFEEVVPNFYRRCPQTKE